ncbi:glyoxalase/bleomycin resistance/extradiol dioxygenase family protein [Adhaeribacter swui]|uniref:Glyoxalase/bleomycin resistance/extradiol dioxygenase family protein n=1 Tax=Adhaeribacter swui TaxID=2086471 RepID=A0A7G7GEJ0_9BACT|nr:glyoxalase/bleomycin resistance/extradiol dioxygenase family protein [Adhaeribacter swui]QNF35574.1 glyoxalase/bleomycin resistance/extradiol dioxygenase family protein [Adhaeribacter swui]
MKQIFINLPVKIVEASMGFYSALGFTVNPLFTFDDQKCMVWSDQIYVMLQTLEMFQFGNTKNLADPKKNTIATFTLPVESLDKLHEMMENGLKAGGTELASTRDEGFMQVRNIEDLDGHLWAIMFLDLDKFKLMTGK